MPYPMKEGMIDPDEIRVFRPEPFEVKESWFEHLEKLRSEEKVKTRNSGPIICIDEFEEGEMCGS